MNERIFDAASYEAPAAEFVTETVAVSTQGVRKGDMFRGAAVTGTKVGTKWVYITVEGRKTPFELEVGVEVQVERKAQTEASSRAASRAFTNRKIAEKLAGRTDGVQAALAKVTQEVTQYGHAGYSAVTDLLAAQAETKLLHQFVGFASTDGKFEDLVDAQIAFVKVLTSQLLADVRHRALSRSTSVVANLLEDVDREAMAKFIDDAKWSTYFA